MEVWCRIDNPAQEASLERFFWTDDGFIVGYRINRGLCFRPYLDFIEEWRLAPKTRWERLLGDPVV